MVSIILMLVIGRLTCRWLGRGRDKNILGKKMVQVLHLRTSSGERESIIGVDILILDVGEVDLLENFSQVYLGYQVHLVMITYSDFAHACLQIEELDLVVGGHSHTFLYSGPPPRCKTVQLIFAEFSLVPHFYIPGPLLGLDVQFISADFLECQYLPIVSYL